MQQWLIWRRGYIIKWEAARFSPDGLTNATHMATKRFLVNVFFPLSLSLSLSTRVVSHNVLRPFFFFFFSSPKTSGTSNNSSHSSLVYFRKREKKTSYFHPRLSSSSLKKSKEILLYTYICIMEPIIRKVCSSLVSLYLHSSSGNNHHFPSSE